jgi:hypothetical protein
MSVCLCASLAPEWLYEFGIQEQIRLVNMTTLAPGIVPIRRGSKHKAVVFSKTVSNIMIEFSVIYKDHFPQQNDIFGRA